MQTVPFCSQPWNVSGGAEEEWSEVSLPRSLGSFINSHTRAGGFWRQMKGRKDELERRGCGCEKIITVGTATQSPRSKEEEGRAQVP